MANFFLGIVAFVFVIAFALAIDSCFDEEEDVGLESFELSSVRSIGSDKEPKKLKRDPCSFFCFLFELSFPEDDRFDIVR